MFHELDCLRESPELQRLLGHYAEAGAADRDAWQDRLMGLEGVEARELVRLHGLLIAFGWVEQHTGNTPTCRPGAVPGCYRVTTAGLRALKLCQSGPADGESDVLAAAAGADAAQGDVGGAPAPRRRERRKAKAARAATAETSDDSIPAEVAAEPAASLA